MVASAVGKSTLETTTSAGRKVPSVSRTPIAVLPSPDGTTAATRVDGRRATPARLAIVASASATRTMPPTG